MKKNKNKTQYVLLPAVPGEQLYAIKYYDWEIDCMNVDYRHLFTDKKVAEQYAKTHNMDFRAVAKAKNFAVA